MGIAWLAVLLALVGCQPPAPAPPPPAPTPAPTPAPAPEPTPTPVPDVVTKLLELHNEARAAKGLPALKLNATLSKAAQVHADWMGQRNQLTHFGDGDPWSRIKDAGYVYSSAGENIAWNQQTPEDVMSDWMGSSGHRANILGHYTEMGAAVAHGAKGDPYWAVDFGTPGAQAAPPTATAEPASGVHEAKHGYLVEPP